ncbi:disease resistance protein RPV1-like [Syzygium oleosum]|uniref:disease resistance protein RPV1-like n=1 Tax=Syzygium oleosum TaxID=219896 RepID=UPI0024BA3101|nr:disease resistance protein RPV1-like [Syzygium oleosum]XP_056172005.1 disease resistance protein RPV1-like [Syzygium oleosum]
MESRTVTLSSSHNTAWECDDSRHGRDAASLKRRRTTPESHFPSASPSSDLAGNNYDVFLSFRRPDTRKGFTDFLYKSLTDAGICVFRDDDELPVGEDIKPALIEAIKQSKVLIPIISRDYASSKSCLMELVQILECKQTMSRETIPIFYEIELSDLKDQRNSLEKSFFEHQRYGVDCETIQKWKLALKEFGRLKGFVTAKIHNGHHSKLIDELIPIVQQKLKKGRLLVTKHLVGVDRHVQEIMRKLGVVHRNGQVIEICGSDVRVLGIYGIGGVGKTTLAKVVYNQLYDRFQGYSYLREIRELHQHDRILSLQNQLISDLRKRSVSFGCSDDAMAVLAEGFRNKQVLILLDDVEDFDQLEVVVGELSWFGPGSRIVVTSRKSDILLKFKEAETYEVEPMEEDKALQLFSRRAFGMDSPSKGFESLSKDIVSATGRLPLALEVTGSRLFGKSKGTWKDTLEKLKDAPHEKVEHALKISYHALDIYAKQIFLDIACFLIGKDERIAFYMWEDCKLYPSSGIEVLLVMSLVKIGENNELLMHDLLRTLGRKIVLNEDPIPCNRSRLWVHNEALSTLRKKEGAPNVQALGLTFDKGSDDCFTSEEFGELLNLRFLNLDRANMRGNFTSLLLELRWLHWRGCHKSSEPLVLNLENLVILDLSWSAVADDWEGWAQIMEKANKLKVLELTGCGQLCKTPCFAPGSKLERLILERCSHLSLIDKSIGNLKYLKSLNIKSTPIALLPEEMGSLDNLEELLIDETSICHLRFLRGSMQQLKTLSASGCKNLAEISESIGCLRSLSYLALDKAIITGLPNSVQLLEGLVELSLRDCQRITALPDSIGMLRSLRKMDLSNTRIQILPESIKNLDRLEVLRMKNTHIRKFPKDIANLEKLEVITFSGCPLIGKIPCDISGLSSLRILKLSFTLIFSLPESICQLSHLQTLHLLHCDELQILPKLPSSLVSLHWGTKNMRIVQGLSYLRDLKVLELVNDPDEEEISSSELFQTESFAWISSLSNLETLKLCLPNVSSLPEDFNALTQLRKLDLSCINLLDLPQLPSSLSKLLIKNCQIQGMEFSNLETLSELELCDCNAWEILGLGNLRLLQVLKISRCNIKNLDGLEQASQLRRFSMSECYSLHRLPDLSKCTSLEIKEIDFCNIQDQPCERHSKNCCSRHCDCPYQYQCGGRCMLRS